MINKREEILYPALIFAVVIITYANSLANGFVWDDIYLVLKNPLIKDWGRVGDIFTSGYWASVGQTGGLYRPLTMVSFMAEHAISGTAPFLYHLDNLVLHFLCSLLIYLILKELSGQGSVPLFSALLFAAHPVHTEAVAWISGRAELLAATFSLLSIWTFLKRDRSRLFFFLSPFFFLLALLSKESAVVTPVLAALCILVYRQPPHGQTRVRQLAAAMFPFVLVFIIYMLPRVYILGGGIGPSGEEKTFFEVKPYFIFLTMCRAFYEYMRLGFFPLNLNADYLFPPPYSFFEIKVLIPLAVLAISLIFLRRLLSFSRVLVFATAWFFITLLPVSNIIPIGIIMSERAMYLPALGFCMVIGALAQEAGRWKGFRLRRPAASFLALAVILAGFATVAAQRNPFWKDQKAFELRQEEMVRHRIELFPDYAPFYHLLAGIYMDRGDYGNEPEILLRESLEFRDKPSSAHLLLAKLYLKRARPGQALEEARAAEEIDPSNSDAYNMQAVSLYQLGRLEDAERLIDRAIGIAPGNWEFYLNKGNIFLQYGRKGEAYALFETALRYNPFSFEALIRQGLILGSEREYARAAEKLARAVEVNPQDPEARFLLAVALTSLGEKEKARAELEIALRLKPGYNEAGELLSRLR